jgi:hypothetical protein
VRAPRPLRATVLALCLLGVGLLAVAGTASAKPVITGFSVTPDRFSSNCDGRQSCLRFTFRAFDPQLARGSKLRWRFVVLKVGDNALKTNQVDTFRNDVGVQRWWAWPSEPFNNGVYVARLIVTGHGSTKSSIRAFRWLD